MAVVYSMTIEEREGLKRSVVLRGRSLPFQGVAFPSRMRVDINYPPGNPVAESQVNGPVWLGTTMRGEWSDMYLWDEGNAATLVGFPELQSQAQPRAQQVAGNTFASGGTTPQQYARTARALRDAIYRIARSGSMIRLEWASIVRFGYLVEFTPNHLREEDIEWEMQWEWTGESENQPVPAVRIEDMTSLLQRITGMIQSTLDSLQNPIYFADEWRTKLTGPVIQLGDFVEQLLGTHERVAQFALSPLELFGTLKATYTGITLAANDMLAAFEATSAALVSAVGGDPAEISYANGVQAATRKLLRDLAAEGRLATESVERFESPAIRNVRTVLQGQTLRDVSLEEYGSAKNWRLLADFNGFESSVVPAGTVVRCPQV